MTVASWGGARSPGDLAAIFPGGFVAIEPAPSVVPEMAFAEALAREGLEPGGIIADGEVHRCHVEGDRRGRNNGWYVMHRLSEDFCAGAYGSWRTGEVHRWSSREESALDPQERAQLEQARAALKRAQEAERERRQREAEERAVAMLRDAESAETHPYLAAKGVRSYGLSVDEGGRLLVPMLDPSGAVRNVQRIDGEGGKRFLAGGQVIGCSYTIGRVGRTVYICEGYATGATVHEATGEAVAVAFNAGNLAPVARAVREAWPTARIVLAADNDRATEGNPGITAATKAAEAVGGTVLSPMFAGEEGADWNDLAQLEGLERVRELMCGPSGGVQLIQMADIMEGLQPPDWLIRGLEERDSITVTYGPPKAGKSFYEIGKCLSVCYGRDFFGHRVRRPGVVAYIAGEGHRGLGRRMLAWHLHHGVERSQSAPLYVSSQRVLMMRPDEAAELYDRLKHIAEQHGGIDKIVIDTLARNFGGDENSTPDMSAFVEALDYHLRVPFGACVTVVHHTGVQDAGRLRGSSVLRGAVDGSVLISKTGAHVLASPRDSKDGELADEATYRLETVDLGMVDEEGEPITSAVLASCEDEVPEELAAISPRARRVHGHLQARLLEIRAELDRRGESERAVTYEATHLRDETREAGIWAGSRQNWARILRELREGGIIVERGIFIDLA